VVHPVHVRRNDDEAKNSVNGRMEADVPMVEHGGCVEEDLEEKDGKGRRTHSGYRGRLDPHREKNFDRMKAPTSREIKIEVRVVHHVEPP
jgi:hypothetical protein